MTLVIKEIEIGVNIIELTADHSAYHVTEYYYGSKVKDMAYSTIEKAKKRYNAVVRKTKQETREN